MRASGSSEGRMSGGAKSATMYDKQTHSPTYSSNEYNSTVSTLFTLSNTHQAALNLLLYNKLTNI